MTATYGPPPAASPGNLPVGTIIISVPEDTGPDASGSYVLGRNVVYQFNTGDTATVFFPYATLTDDNVIAAGQRMSLLINGLYGLSNG